MAPEMQAPTNRAGRRRKVRARFYRGPNDFEGTPFTSKGVRHRQGIVPDSLDHNPSKNPSESNHERVLRQRAARESRRALHG